MTPTKNLQHALLAGFLCLTSSVFSQQGLLLPTNSAQTDFRRVYKCILDAADQNFRTTSPDMDKVLFPEYSEYSPYWIVSGTDKGAFVYPDQLPQSYASISNSAYSGYTLAGKQHLAVHFKRLPKTVAIFRSALQTDNHSISWQAGYFSTLFDSYLFPDVYQW